MKNEDPDIFCIQETKCQEKDVPKVSIYSLFYICYLTCGLLQCLHILLLGGEGGGGEVDYSITRLFFN